ncbi:MAG: hypothetical protein RBT33_03085 [Candidatus Dojkabacteria bacterium]|jgi:hypothetical protein|nr:hypothetical protein [Candidatus Dojkabacteria bacterium]
MAPFNSEVAEKFWSEQDRKKEIFVNFLIASSETMKMKYEEEGEYLSFLSFKKNISSLLKNDISVTFNSERTVVLKPLFFEVVTLVPSMEDCIIQLVSTPIEEFGILKEEDMDFAKVFEDTTLGEEEKIRQIYSYLTDESEEDDDRALCARDDENYYFFLAPAFEEDSPGHEKIKSINCVARTGNVNGWRNENQDSFEDTQYH